MRTPYQFAVAMCLCISLFGGCQLMSEQADFEGNALLQPAPSSPDSVKMEIIWARFPAGDPELNNEAWQDIDESQLDPSIHRELVNNGFRAGIINGKLPDAVSRALNQGKAPPEEAAKPISGETNQLLADPIVRGRVRQMPRNQRCEIAASEVYPSLTLLVSDDRELGGRPFQQAQAMYAMRVDPQPDRTTLVELTPELHYGAPRMRFTGSDEGMLYQAPMRDRQVFEKMRMKLKLAPGDMLVVMSLTDAGSRLGHYFHHVDASDGQQQKLILIRLADVPSGDTFAAMNDE